MILFLLFCYVTNSHTGGLRIRFVRFRQTVWRVMHIVKAAKKYTGQAGGTSTGWEPDGDDGVTGQDKHGETEPRRFTETLPKNSPVLFVSQMFILSRDLRHFRQSAL